MIHPQSLSVGYAQVGFPISPEYPHSHDNYCPCCGAPRNRSFPSQLPQYAPPPMWWGGLATTGTPDPLAIPLTSVSNSNEIQFTPKFTYQPAQVADRRSAPLGQIN